MRVKLDDPAYAAWFLSFNCTAGSPTAGCHVPVCDNNYSPPLCTSLYHDQGQTPGYPHGDGDCAPPACDCGKNPCGEYGSAAAPRPPRPRPPAPNPSPSDRIAGEYLFDFRSLDVSVNGETMLDWYVNE